MSFFKKKPVVIEAIQFFKSQNDHLPDWIKKVSEYSIPVGGLFIQTLEGKMLARDGDYIIKGIKGEVYPCKPDIFKATYEQVDEVLEDEL